MKNSLNFNLREFHATYQKKAVYFNFDDIIEEKEFMNLTNKDTYDFFIEMLQNFNPIDIIKDFNETAFVLIKKSGEKVVIEFDIVDMKSNIYHGLKFTPLD